MTRNRLCRMVLMAAGVWGFLSNIHAAGEGSEIISRFDRAFSVVDSLIFGEQPRLKLETDGLMEGFASGDSTTISPQLDNALIRNTEAKLREGGRKDRSTAHRSDLLPSLRQRRL